MAKINPQSTIQMIQNTLKYGLIEFDSIDVDNRIPCFNSNLELISNKGSFTTLRREFQNSIEKAHYPTDGTIAKVVLPKLNMAFVCVLL